MEERVISGDKFALKWIEKLRDKRGTLSKFFQKGIKLSNPWGSNKVKANYCSNCKKIIIDANDKID